MAATELRRVPRAEDTLARIVAGAGKVHAVHAAGGPEDGSLAGFTTLCGLALDDLRYWWEDPREAITCGNSARIAGQEVPRVAD